MAKTQSPVGIKHVTTSTDDFATSWQHDTSPVGYVTRKLNELFSMKSGRYVKINHFLQEYKQNTIPTTTNDDTSKYSMNTGFALVNEKHASILAATPKYDFIPLTEDAMRFRRVAMIEWNSDWKTSRTDEAINRIVHDAMLKGSGWGIEEMVCDRRTIQEPSRNSDGTISFEEKTITDYEGPRLTYIPWENVFVNGRSLDESSEAITIQYLPREEALNLYGNNPMYTGVTDENIPRNKFFYINTNGQTATLQIIQTNGDTSQGGANMQINNIVTVLKYYNKAADRYVVLMNNRWINPLMKDGDKCYMPLPFPHKQIPLVCYTDHYIWDNIYGLGEMDITERSRLLKDATRSMILEVIRAQAGLITINPEADFDESLLSFGFRDFARVAKEDINFFSPNINASTLQYLESKLDEDIIIETGVDFKNQILGPNETATKTAGRIDAAKRRINQNIKYNAYTFYERLARLRIANVAAYYHDKERVIPVEGKTYDGTVEKPLNGGYGLFIVKPEYRALGKYNLVPVMDSLFGDTTDEKKQKFIEYIQLFGNMVDPATGKPIVNPINFIESSRGIMDDVVDIDKLTAKTPETQSPDQMLNEMDAMDKGLPTASMNGGADSGFVPPEQRSGAPVLLGSSPSTK